jgi:UDP-glucose 4-epimerase
MKISVTGSTGFLGSALCRTLERMNHRVVKFGSYNHNLLDVISFPRCDVVYHIAGNSRVYLSQKNPRFDFEINALGTIKVLDAVVKSDIPKLVYISSNTIYKDLIVQDESSPIGNNSYGQFYGLSKLAGELYVKQYAETFGFDYIIFRPTNFYGPKMVKNVIYDLIQGHIKDIRVPLNYTWDSEIDFIYIEDLVRALILALDMRKEILNLSYGKSYSIKDIYHIIQGCFNRRIEVVEGKNRVLMGMDNRKLISMGWKPEVSLKDGIIQTVDSFIKSTNR